MPDPQLRPTAIPGLVLVDLDVQRGDDGWFTESWHLDKLTALGLPVFRPVQQNIRVFAHRGDTRGFHGEPWDRVLQVIHGLAFGAWVDLRPGPMHGTVATAELGPGTAVYVPRGVGNALQILKRDTTVVTLMNEQWTPEARQRYLTADLYDPRFDVQWPIGRRAARVVDSDVAEPPPQRPARAGGPRRAVPEPARAMEDPAEPFRVLFVCTANICRSAYADVAARAGAPKGVEFGSAGTSALVGQPIDPPMAEQLQGIGRPAEHRARQLTKGLADEADLILAMTSEHRRYILDVWPGLAQKTFVLGHAARVTAQLSEPVPRTELAELLWANRTVDESDDVRDPYNQGVEAAEFAASTIDSYLEVLLRALRSYPPA